MLGPAHGGRRFDVAQLGGLPRNVHVEPWTDQADALAETDVVSLRMGTTFERSPPDGALSIRR